jgi:heptosyltransferase III
MSYGNYPDLRKVKKILVVKMRHHGDVLLTSPVFSNLKKALPAATIDAFIYKDTLPMLEGHPAIDQFLLYDRNWKTYPFFKKLYKELSLLSTIRNNDYDLVLNLTEGDRGAIAALAAGSLYRVGFDSEKKGFLGKNRVYTHVVKTVSTPRHTVERQLDVLRRIGIFPLLEDRDLFIDIPAHALQNIQRRLEDEEIPLQDYIVVHPVSRWRFKCPPPDLMASVILELEKRGKKVIVTSGPDALELAQLDQILSMAPGHQVLNLGGKISLKELAALIRLSGLVVCVDSVPLHIASAVKAPVAVLFGPSSELNWGPWMHPHSRVIAKNLSCRPCFKDGCGGSKMSDCLYTLSIEQIMENIDALLVKNQAGPKPLVLAT